MTRALAVLVVTGAVLAGCGGSGAKPNGEASKHRFRWCGTRSEADRRRGPSRRSRT